MATSRASTSLSATVAANIAAARKARGLTQRELADQINGIESMSVSRWERGEHRPSLENLVALADVLGHKVAWFYTDHSSDPTTAAA